MKKILAVAVIAIQVVTLINVSANFANAAFAQCSDGINNDPAQDNLIDAADPGCHSDFNASNSSSYNPNLNSEINPSGGGGGGGFTQCSDGINNDPLQDSLIDAADPGCHSDFNANNSSSYNPNLNSEINPTGGGGASTQCSDGINNDPAQDSLIDMADPDCTGPNDNSEFSSCLPNGCNPPPPQNTCPAISNLSSSYSASVGVQFVADANAFDAEGDAFSFSLTQAPAGMVINSATGVITWTPTSAQAGQSFTVTVRTTDARGASCQSSFTIQVQTPPNNPPVCPVFTAQYPNYTASVGTQFSVDLNASDPDGDSFSFSLTQAPAGMTINSATGLITWTPSSGQAGQSYTVQVQVTDSRGATCQSSFSIQVQVVPQNRPPFCPAISDRTLNPGQSVHIYFTATDPDGQNVTYTASGLPSGAQFYPVGFPQPNPSNESTLIWTPSASQTGVFTPVIRATDPQGLYCESSARITVLAPVQLVNPNPVINNTNNNTNNNNNVNQNTNTNNIVINGVSYQGGGQTNICNDGIDNDGDGRIDYNDPGCSQAGNEWFNPNPPQTYQCSDGIDNDGDGRVDLNDPDCTGYYDNSEYGGTTLAQCRDGYDNDGDGRVDYPNDPGCYGYDDPSEFEGSLAQCRDGIDNDGDGRVDYPNDPGCFSYDDVSEFDGTGTGVPVINSSPVTTASEGVQYLYDVNAYDPEGQVITYSLAISPSGMIINSATGLITWTPNFSQGGISYFVSVRASDGVYSATQNYIIAVTDLNPAPTPTPTPTPQPTPIPVIPVVELRIFNVRLSNDATGNVLATFETTVPANGSVRFGAISEAEKFGGFTYPMSGQNQTAGMTLHQINLGVIPLNQTHYMRAFATAGSQAAVTAELAFVQLTTGIVGPGQVGGATIQGQQTLASAFATIGHWIISPGFLLFLVIVLLIALIVALMRRRSVVSTSGPIEIHS